MDLFCYTVSSFGNKARVTVANTTFRSWHNLYLKTCSLQIFLFLLSEQYFDKKSIRFMLKKRKSISYYSKNKNIFVLIY